jgi:hypothetical protein
VAEGVSYLAGRGGGHPGVPPRVRGGGQPAPDQPHALQVPQVPSGLQAQVNKYSKRVSFNPR